MADPERHARHRDPPGPARGPDGASGDLARATAPGASGDRPAHRERRGGEVEREVEGEVERKVERKVEREGEGEGQGDGEGDGKGEVRVKRGAPDDQPSWQNAVDAWEDELQTLFAEATSFVPGHDGADRATHRSAVLGRARDGRMRARLTALLAVHDALPPERERPSIEPPDPLRWIGRRFGDFTVASLLASGATADVYVARQGSPARDVVLKIRRARHGTAGQIARFLAEAERLAGFSHPGVAHIYGSGFDEIDGLAVAWIAMERIVGCDLAQWRDRAAHPVPARCAMIARVAEIVAAAHRAGIVHRDLAPRNITVDADGAPRVLDYGIARTLHQLDEHPTLEGTPGFASPEQDRGMPASVADDVFALGRLLAWIAPDAPSAARRLSLRATGPAESLPDAAGFAATLERSASRRPHRLGLAATALVLAAAATPILLRSCAGDRVGSEVHTPNAASSNDPTSNAKTSNAKTSNAPPSNGDAARKTPAEARSSSGANDAADAADAIDGILMALLESASAERGGTSQTTMLDAIRSAEARILAETAAPLRARHRALERIGDIWFDFGEYERGASVTEAAAALCDGDAQASPLRAARLRAAAAGMRARADDLAAARAAVESSGAELARAAQRVGDGATAPADEAEQQVHADYAQGHVYLALAAKLNGDRPLARRFARIAEPFHRTGVFAGSVSAVTFLINTAKLEQALGNLDAAVALSSEAVELSRTAEADSEVEQLATRALHATILEAAGRLAEAAAVYEASRLAWTRIGGPDHPRVVTAINNLGLNALRQGDAAHAVTLLEDAVERARRAHGPRHADTLDTLANLALAYEGTGRSDRAAEIFEANLPVLAEARGAGSEDECLWRLKLGSLHEALGEPGKARAEYEQALAIAQKLDGGATLAADARKSLEKLGTAPSPPKP